MKCSKSMPHDWFTWDHSACLAVASCITAEDFVAVAVEGLELCCSAVANPPQAVQAVARVGRSDWGRGHDAFDAVRQLTLAMELIEPRPRPDPSYLLLFVAENAARMIYNASGTKYPFDDDSGAWLIRAFRQFAQSLPQPHQDRVTAGLRELILQGLDQVGNSAAATLKSPADS